VNELEGLRDKNPGINDFCTTRCSDHGLTSPPTRNPRFGYDIPNYLSDLKVVFTNKTLTTPIRGAGRPQGIYVIERMMDIAARQLGIDPVEIRRRNLIPRCICRTPDHRSGFALFWMAELQNRARKRADD
jgi:hypothetical protein